MRSVRDIPRGYKALDKFLGSKDDRRLCNNTYARRGDDGSIEVTLHATTIVTLWPDGRVRLDAGRWRTVTTKQRMNAVLEDAFVTQSKWEWFVGGVPFHNGIVLKDGKEVAA